MHHIKKVTVGLIFLIVFSGLVYLRGNSVAQAVVPEPYSDPHGQYTSDTSKCAKCHSGHTAPAQGVARGSTQRETCYACHNGSNASPNIRGQFGEETIGRSVYADTGGSFHPVPTEQQVCTRCHDPHLAVDGNPGGIASLLSVGPSKTSSGNAVCGYCHGPDSTAPGGDILTPFTTTAHDVYMTNPSSGTQIKCARCHQPHGSPFDSLLRTQIVSQEGGVYDVTGNNNTLCFGCHTNATRQYSGQTLYEQTKHGTPYAIATVSETSTADFSQGTHSNTAATMSGDITLSGSPGISFNGSNSQVNLPSGYTGIQNTFTYEFWAKPAFSYTHQIDGESTSGTAGTGGQRYAIGAMSGGSTGQAGVGVSIGTNGISIYEHATSYMPALLVYQSSITDWVHIAVVYNNKTPSLYINGQLVKTGLTSPMIPVPSQRFGWGDYGYFSGSLDDIRLWNYARNQTQIQSDMYKQLAGSESGLIGYWKMNEGSGTTVSDSAGTNHGTASNVVWNAFSASGNRISPEFSLPALTAAGSKIQWNSSTPASTTLTVDTSVFLSGSWQSWQPVSNGGTIPGISAGTNLSGGKLKYRVNLSTSNTRITPWFNDVSINVNHASTVVESVYPGTAYQRSQCLNCHEPHGKPGFANYLRGAGNNLCYGCHVDSKIPAQYSYRGITAYNNTPHVSASVYNLSYSAGDCLNCHAVHGQNGGTGAPYPKQLKSAKSEVCFGGANGACHSSSDNSDRKVNIKDKFAGSDVLSHHSVNPAEWASGGNSKLECVNCHDPHLNNAGNKLVDPQNRFTAYSVYNNVEKYISSDNEVYVLVKARHDGKAPVITVNPTAANAQNSATIDWWTDEPSKGTVHWGTAPGSLGSSASSSNELLTHHTVTVSGLAAGTNYWFKVRGTDAVNNYGESNAYLMDEIDPVIPSAPVISSAGMSATVTWTTNEPATSFIDYMPQVNYAAYNDFAGPSVISLQGDSNNYVESHTVNVSGLTPGESYKVRVRSYDYRGRGVTSLITNLIYASRPPNAPTAQNGPNYSDAGNTSDHTVTMTWNATTDPDPGDTITGYYVELSQSSTFNPAVAPIYNSGTTWLTGTSWTTNINNDGYVTWYWRVKAKDNWNSQSAWSPVYNFTHQGYIPPATTTSCPNLYVWDGEKYQFVTDISGASIGKRNISTGRYTDIYPGLNVAIPWNMLQEKDGRYILKVKSERDEVEFIDSLALTAVDHPVGTRVAFNDLMRGKEPNKLYTYNADIKPVKKATYVNIPIYTGGKPTKPLDITDLISEADGKEAVGIYGDDNQFTFELGDLSEAKEIKLVLVGWSEWGTKQEQANRAKNISKGGTKRAKTFMEILQPDGTWKKYPVWYFNSMVKTSVLDLTGKFPEGIKNYVVRLRGMHKPHVDYVGLDTSPKAEITLTNTKLLDATLGYHGASVLSEDQRFFDYYKVMKDVTYHEGKFTRFGNVLPLVKEEDDGQVVMDTGDELTLHYKALPPPAPGMTRSFILRPLVYYKEYEMAKVEPMPFRGLDMNKLPHSLGEYPAGAKEFMAIYNTREHKAGERYRSTSQRISQFLSEMGGYITSAWNDAITLYKEEKNRPGAAGSGSTGNPGSSVLTYKLFRNSPYAGFVADKGHYSLNTDYVSLRTDNLKEMKNFYSDSAGFGMWESGGDTPPTPTSKGTDRTDWASKVRTDDATMNSTTAWITDYFPLTTQGDGSFNYQMFRFVQTTPVKDVSSLLFHWRGKGEPSPNYNVHIGFWNFQTGQWDELTQQAVGQENSVSIQKYVDYNSYCYKCHSGTAPSGVQLGTVEGRSFINLGSVYPSDKHGNDNAGQQGFSDAPNGYFSMSWRVTSLGTMKLPYARGHSNLPCSECHDLHGSQNVYHLRENPNGTTVGQVPANTSTATNNQVEAWCQACHQGNRTSYHDYCLQCHKMVAPGHWGWTNNNVQYDDFNKPCLSCHKHGGATGPHSYGSCHCGFDTTVKAF